MNIKDEDEIYNKNPQLSKMFRRAKLDLCLAEVKEWIKEGKSKKEILEMMDRRILVEEDIEKIFNEQIPEDIQKRRKYQLNEKLEWIREKLKEGLTQEEILKNMDRTVLIASDVTEIYHEYLKRKHIQEIFDENKIRQEFPQKLKYLMEKQKISVEALCFMTDISCGSIRDYLEGKAFPNNLRFLKLCYTLNVNLDYFVNQAEIKKIRETNEKINELNSENCELKRKNRNLENEIETKNYNERYLNRQYLDLKREVEKNKLVFEEKNLILKNYREKCLEYQMKYGEISDEDLEKIKGKSEISRRRFLDFLQ